MFGTKQTGIWSKNTISITPKYLPVSLNQSSLKTLTGSNLQCPQHLALALPNRRHLMHRYSLRWLKPFSPETQSYMPQKSTRSYRCVWLKECKTNTEHQFRMLLQWNWIFIRCLNLFAYLRTVSNYVKFKKGTWSFLPPTVMSPSYKSAWSFHAWLKILFH